MSTLLAVVALALPVSVCADIQELEMSGLPLVLSAQGYWIAIGPMALVCGMQSHGVRSGSAQVSDAAEQGGADV